MELKHTALIVEDVQDTSDYIHSRVRELIPQIGEIFQAYSINEAYELISNQSIDIVFLDIQLPTGTGFDLLKKLSEDGNINFEIIFITGENAKEYTLRAIKYSALDFLYKPLDDTDLLFAANKALEKLNNKHFNRQIRLLMERVGDNQGSISQKIAFHLHNGIIEFLHIDDIKYLQADGVVTYIYLTNNTRLSATKNLGFYKDMLISDYNFYMISNSLLVNHNYIKQYDHRQLLVTLTDGTHLYASKRYGKSFKDIFATKGAIATIGGFFKSFLKK
ncbi:MAG: LytTR family DNA-binding domain-containing protein [Carboxylicivirga sp.]|jgi:two-component system LytT family response regulator|nr:LytTR family DNA-binding domain-containing protein [Carboxylicivirga sp.]